MHRITSRLRPGWRNCALICAMLLLVPVHAASLIKIGILAFTDKSEAMHQWQSTADYLQQNISDFHFEVVPLTYDELRTRVAERTLDFVLTSPEQYVVLRNTYAISPMATLARKINGKPISGIGSVIFTRADQSDITELADVRQKRVIAVSRYSLGGFMAAAQVFKEHNLDLQSEKLVTLQFLGMPHADVVRAVTTGAADVGIVQTGVLEELQANGALEWSKIRILNAINNPQYPLLNSTHLYPEWSFSAMPDTNPDLSKTVSIALMHINDQTPAAIAGGYSGFFPPSNYESVEELMRQLNMYPGMPTKTDLARIWDQYGTYIQILALVMLVGGMAASISLYIQNKNLRRLTALYRKAQEDLEIMAVAFNSQVGMAVTDRDTRIVRVNDAFCATLGYSEQELTGTETAKLRGKGVDRGFMDAVWKHLHIHHHWQGELMCKHAAGHDIPCIVTITAVRLDRVGLSGFIASFVNISTQKAAEARIRQLAYFDQLTDLPNRRYFLEKLESKLSTSELGGSLGALLFLDLDHFKLLNDSHGHSVGDELLRLISVRLRHLTAQAGLAARLGGDEFVVMLTDLGADRETAMNAALQIAQQLQEAILAPYRLSAHSGTDEGSELLRYSCSGSIGLALFGEQNEKIAEVLKRADMAMYQAKQAGRNAIRKFDPSTQDLLNQRTALVSDLNLAISETQFQLFYQVQVDKNNLATGAECLLRWNHPSLGMISPTLFIPLAEECGAISFIGHWVMREACKTLARWAGDPELRNLTLSVNVSPKQFIEHDFVAKLIAAVEQYGVNTQRLILELTEGAVLQNVDEVIEKMIALRKLGVRFSIDDFGTGYSSLSYLQRLPISEIKIDRSFVHAMSQHEGANTIVAAIIALAEKLEFSVVAEGVETAGQWDSLIALGVPTIQGFMIAHPSELPAMEAYVRAATDAHEAMERIAMR